MTLERMSHENNSCLQENDAIYQVNAALLTDRLEDAQRRAEELASENAVLEGRITDLYP